MGFTATRAIGHWTSMVSEMPNHNACMARARGWARYALLATTVMLAGCDDFLTASPVAQVDAEVMDQPENAHLLVNGAIGQFECAFYRYIHAGGLVGMELEDSRWVPGFQLEVARRQLSPSGFATQGWTGGACGSAESALPQFHTPLHRARWMADETLRKLEEWSDAQVQSRGQRIATMAAYSGYNRILLGEGMCTTALDIGPEIGPTELFTQAIQKFDRAIEAGQAAAAADIVSMARVGKARALLNLGQPAEAAAVAGQVPEGFVHHATASAISRARENRIFHITIRREETTVGVPYRNMQFQGVSDPRVPVTDAGRTGPNGITPMWLQEKYSAPDTPAPIASWEEAQLIRAEAAWVAGNDEAAVDIINVLHARAGLPPFESTDRQAIWEQILYERAAELFLQSHHLGDIRRYGLPLFPEPGTADEAGNVFGDHTCFPMPDSERQNNPNV